MSRAWNKRKDAYGCQDLKSRSRFLVEILQAIRKRVGESFVVGVRINGAELGIEDGITSKESQDFAKILQEASADYICMQARGFGPYELLAFPEQIQYPEPMVDLAKKIRKPGALVPLGEAVKQAVTIPIIAVGRLDATLGEWILGKGMADLIGINRRLFADPEYPNKVAAGRLEEIAPCTACMECWASQQVGDRTRCRINPALGRESELVVKPAEKKKKVVIVGGGPAGMEAARMSAIRGHEVVLYEKRNSLGGLLPLATLIKGSQIEDLPAIISYLKIQLKKVGVQVRLGTEVNIALIEKVKPDVVIIGSGGIPDVPNIPGMNNHNVVSSITLHRAAQRYLRFVSPKILRWLTRFYLPVGRMVIIVGGLMHGCELAEFLVKRGRKVTLVETSDQLGKGIHEINRPRLLRWLTQKGVVMLTGVKYEKVYDRGLSIVTKEGKRETINADTIVLATPPRPDTELFNTLKDKVKEVYLIGDSKEPRTIIDAIDDGSQIGRRI